MKKKTCLWLFAAAAILSVAFRVFELSALTEYETGFIFPQSKIAAVVVTAVIAFLILVSAVFSGINAIGGKQGNSFYLVSSLSSLILGVSICFQFTESFSGIPLILRILSFLFAVLSAVYFIAFCLRAAIHFPFSARLSAIPAAFFVFKAACVTIKSAYHTVISDTLFEIAAYCFVMLFFLEFVRLANGAKSKSSVKRFSSFGTAASLLSISYSLPKLILYIVSPSAAHGFSANEIMMFFVGVYIAGEVYSRLLFAQEKDEKATIYYVGKH